MDSKKFHPRLTRQLERRGLALVLIFLFVAVSELSAGVLVAPTSLVLSDRKTTGRLTVQNPTDKPQEISIGFSFGIPMSDSLGNVQVRLQDSTDADPRSAVGWIKAFPRKMILQPNSSQVIRFIAHPPKDLPDGEYWARVVVRSQEGQTVIPVPASNETITTKLNMIMQTAISLKYRTGNLISKLDVRKTETVQTDSTLHVLIDMVNPGNVSYIGLLKCRLVDAGGKEISKNQVDLAVYRELKRRVDLLIAGDDFQKPYKVEVSISNQGRSDIPTEDIIVGNSIEYTAVVE